MTGRIFSINTSPGGVPKLPVPEALVSKFGLFGDGQRNRRFHGGPDRAVCLFSIERIRALEAEGHPLVELVEHRGVEGHPISAGSTGENITVTSVDWNLVAPGLVIEVGEAVLEITTFTTPCRTIRDSFAGGTFMRMSHKLYPGWSRVYARVLEEGMVRTADPVTLKLTGELRPQF